MYAMNGFGDGEHEKMFRISLSSQFHNLVSTSCRCHIFDGLMNRPLQPSNKTSHFVSIARIEIVFYPQLCCKMNKHETDEKTAKKNPQIENKIQNSRQSDREKTATRTKSNQSHAATAATTHDRNKRSTSRITRAIAHMFQCRFRMHSNMKSQPLTK